ncbi:transposase [Butyricimonas sp.]|uniref:transposase n=1 Tax=Butyricimonas sp. TaxID=1969738 RepID=UPI00338EA01E
MEITLDMSSGMHAIARECFPNAEQVIDRFHVQKLACDALQELRIEHRWERRSTRKPTRWKTPVWKGKSTGREDSVTGKPGRRFCPVPGCCFLKTRLHGA